MPPLTSKKSTRDLETREGYRWLALTDPYLLAKRFLGYTELTDSFHAPLCEAFQTTPYMKNLWMVPRGFFKTTILSIAANIRRFLRNPDTRILLASNKAENAESILAEIKGLITPGRSEAADRLYWMFPDILYRDPAKEADVWTTNRIAVKTKLRRREPTITTIGLHGELTGRHYDHGTFDDLVGLENSRTREERQNTIEWWKASQSLLDPGATEDIVGCLPADAAVLMEDGTTKPIDRVKPGERVWAADVDGSLQARTVKAMVPQGLAETLTITTSAKTLRATPNHPFLCHTEKGLDLFWRRADQLETGDYIVSIKEIPGELDHPWMTEDFCWLFGFLMGDGWASVYERRAHIGICLSKDEELNARLKRVASEWLPGKWSETPFGFLRNDARNNAVVLQGLGLAGTAKTKRLPQWAFRLPPGHRRELLRGFCEADGCHQRASDDSWRVEIANRGLIEDLRHLANLCGVRTGALISRQRAIQAPNSPAEVTSETYHCLFNFAATARREIYHLSKKVRVSPGLRQERIVSVTKNDEQEPVYDLTVDGTPSFFANGLAVHNTPWDWDDLYAYLLEQKAKHGMKLGVYKRACWEPRPDGYDTGQFGRVRATFPERFPVHDSEIRKDADGKPLTNQEALLTIKAAAGSTRFAAQYLLDPADDETAVFQLKHKVIVARGRMPDPAAMWMVMTIDPAESEENWADYTALVVAGFDHRNQMFVYHMDRGRWTETELIREVYAFANRYPGITAIGIEAVAFQKYLLNLMTAEAEKRNHYLPIFKLERDTRKTKKERIRVLQPFWESGSIALADDLPVLDEFLDEAQKFRLNKKSTHDDMLDALADCLQLRVRPHAPQGDAPPVDPQIAEEIAVEQAIQEARTQAGRPKLSESDLAHAVHHKRILDDLNDARDLVVAGAFDNFFH